MEREALREKEGRGARSGSLGLEQLDGESMRGGGVVGRKCEAILEREREREEWEQASSNCGVRIGKARKGFWNGLVGRTSKVHPVRFQVVFRFFFIYHTITSISILEVSC